VRERRAAGFDRTFDAVRARRFALARPVAAPVEPPCRRRGDRVGADAITLDPHVGTVRIDDGVELDPGGIGKGFAADLIVEELIERGASGAMVNIGGDLRAEGTAPDGGWRVAVADPCQPERNVATLAIAHGAIASTWRTKRAWLGPDGEARHHLIDPDTGSPASTGLAGVTVVAGRGWEAEVLAKAVFLAGRAGAERLLEPNRAAALFVSDSGTGYSAGDLAPFLVDKVMEGVQT
jgi:thiamine biosynthesis lipoprotein